MRKPVCVIIIFLLHYASHAQTFPVNRQQFFLDDRVIDATLTLDIKKARNDKKDPAWLPANIEMQFYDTAAISEPVNVKPRGIYRKEYCDMAALMLDFKKTTAPKLYPLKKLKLVGSCHNSGSNEALLLKEYVAYKIYNFITNMSFRVRLLHVTYKDSKQKIKPYTQYAFLIEDLKDLAKRNNCIEIKETQYNTEGTDRMQVNLLSIFEYMIGNTDWSVPKLHNIKLMVSKNDTLGPPFPVAYDFDYAGIVNASYAVPDELLGTTSVTERVYRGFPRNMAELQINLDKFKQKKEQILFYLSSFPLLSDKEKKEMIKYTEQFYKIIENKNMVKQVFIDNARRD